MEARKQAVIDLFTANSCLEDFDASQIEQIVACNNMETFNQLMQDYDIIRQKFQEQLKTLLQLSLPKQQETPKLETPEEEQIPQEKVFEKDIIEYKDLLEANKQVQKVQGSFSIKHIRMLKLSIFIAMHPELKEKEDLDIIKIDTEAEIKGLRYSLQTQGKMDFTFSQYFQRLQNSNSLNEKNAIIQKISQKLMPLDVDFLNIYVNKNKQVSRQISNKEGIVLIGLTGAGKSTTILALLGHEMVQKSWQGKSWVTPKKLLDIKKVKNLVACPSNRSVTRTVTAIQLPENMSKDILQKIHLIDTPGFKDTQGSVIDLSNSYGAAQAIKSLKSARFVVLVSSKDSGSRDQGFSELIYILNDLFPKYKDVKQSIAFIFNRYSQKQISQINIRFQATKKQLPPSKTDDPNIQEIFNDLILKTKQPKQILTFDPLNKNVQYSKNMLQKILSYNKNSKLQSNFNVFHGQTARQDIEKQCAILKDYCIHYFELQKVEICRYFISQIQKLYEVLGKNEAPEIVKTSLKKVQTKIVQNLNATYTRIIDTFNKAISTNTLSKQDVKDYLRQIDRADRYDIFKCSFKIPNLRMRLTENGNDKILVVVYNLKQNFQKIDQKAIDSFLVLINGLKKQEILRELEGFYQQKLSEISKEYQMFIKEGNFNKSVDYLIKHQAMHRVFNILLSEQKRDKFPPLNKIIIQQMQNRQKNISMLIQNISDCKPEEFQQIYKVAIYFRSIQQSYDYLRAISNRDQVKQKCLDFTTFITEKVERYWNQAEEYLNGKSGLSSEVASKIIKLFRQRNEMKKFPQLKMLIIEKTNAINHKVKICLESQKKVLLNFISQIQNQKVNYNVLKKQVIRLDQAAMRIERVLDFYENQQQNHLEQTSMQIKQFFDDNLIKIQEIRERKINLSSEDIGIQMHKLGEVLEVLLAFHLSDQFLQKTDVEDSLSKKKIIQAQERSKLFRRAELISEFNQIKHHAENIFECNIRQIEGVIHVLNSQRGEIKQIQTSKSHNIKLESIESCLKFIYMGSRIFSMIPSKQFEFLRVQKALTNEIVEWERTHVNSIKQCFKDLRENNFIDSKQTQANTSKQDTRTILRILKNKINSLKDIKLKYTQINRILKSYERNFFDDELLQEISELYIKSQQQLKKCDKVENPSKYLTHLTEKFRILSGLDCYNSESNTNDSDTFTKLHHQSKTKLEKQATSLQNKFNYALQIHNYPDIIKYLLSIYVDQRQLYEASQSRVCTLIRTQMNAISQRKNRSFETPEQIQTLIEGLQNLLSTRRAIQSTTIQNNSQIKEIIKDIIILTQSLEENIKQYYDKMCKQIQKLIVRKKLSEAHSHLISLDKIEKILKGTSIEISKVDQFKAKIEKKIEQYNQNYVKSKQINFMQFRQDYDTVFDSNTTYYRLIELKKEIIRAIDNLMSQKYLEIQKKSNFNNNNYANIKQLINQLPQELKTRRVCQDLIKEARDKCEKWEKEKKKINNEAVKYQIFDDGGYFNPRLIDYFQDEDAQTAVKQILLNKLKTNLSKIIKFEKEKVSDFLKAISTRRQLDEPQSKKQYPINEIIQVYQDISSKIEKKIIELVGSFFTKMEQFLRYSENFCNAETNLNFLKQFVSELIQYSNILNEKFKNKIYPDNLKQSVKERADQFISRIVTYHKSIKDKVDNIKKCINVNQQQELINSEIQKVFNLKVIEDFAAHLLKQILKQDGNNDMLNIISQKISQFEPEFVLPLYNKIVEENILPKFQDYIGFSLRKNFKLLTMDQRQIEKQFKQKQALFIYLSINLNFLFNSIGILDSKAKVQQVVNHQIQLNSESQQIYTEILDFSSNPIIQDERIQEIRKMMIIVQKYSVYNSNIANTKETFIKSIRQYHTKISEELLTNIRMLEKKTIQDQANNTRELEQSKQLKKQILKQKSTAYELKIATMKTEHDSKKAGLEGEEKQKLETEFSGEVASLKNLFDQDIQKENQQIDLKQAKRQEHSNLLLKEAFQNVSKKYEKMVSLSNTLMPYKDYFQRNKQIIQEIKKVGRKKWLQLLVDSLNNIGSTTAGYIIFSNVQLKQLAGTHFKKNIESLTAEKILDQFFDSSTLKSDLRKTITKLYDSCNSSYNKEIEEFKTKAKAKNTLIGDLIKYVDREDKRITLLGQIFALWTIITSTQQDGQVFFTYQPHIAQMLTTILLLGLPQMQTGECQKYLNRFAEIQTGQGKSLILAILAAYFALNKKDVDCVCYSQNLSSRDKNTFNQLFSALQVSNKIRYCTFNDLTQSFTNNKQINLREQCNNIIQKKNNSDGLIRSILSIVKSEYTGKIQNKVLLMDEADVFFIDQFYGNIYIPSTSLKSNNIKQLYNLIWTHKNQINNLTKIVYDSLELKKVLDEFPKFKELIQNHIPHMINGVKNYNHEYQVLKGKIVYKDQDGYSDKISYGYKTVFAYFYEHSKKVIAQLPSSVSSIDLALCEISYAQLPKMYDHIIGVTGTLQNLSQCKKDILKAQYNIIDNYIVPSVYKQSKRNDRGYHFATIQNHYEKIIENLQVQYQKRRPIMVFFNSIYDVSKFHESQLYRPYLKDTVILSQKHDQEERRIRIMRAMGEGKISLITKAFARGIDFIIYEKNVVNIGGGHLIIAYTIDQKSEQTQVMGRVARQGDPGSSIFILTDQDLKNKLGLKASELSGQNQQKIRQTIDEARQKKMSEKQEKTNIEIAASKLKHQKTIKFLNNILNKQLSTALQNIIQLNLLPQIFFQKPVKTVLAIDATASMTQALLTTKICLQESFSRVYNILKGNTKVANGFEMQIASYRNYNVKQDHLLEISPFETSPQPLINFVKKIIAFGGWGEEALEVVFNHCLKIQDLTQIIVITDAKMNTEKDTIRKRADKYKHSGYGQDYWSKTLKFNKILNSKDLFNKLKQKKILIHTLPIGSKELFQYYKNLSDQTVGQCQLFNPVSSKATSQLTDFISTSILSQLGGNNSDVGKELVDSYRKFYKAS